MTARYEQPFDVRRFGAKPGYTASTSAGTRGRDNGPAFRECAAAVSTHHGARMYVPGSAQAYWLGEDPAPFTFTAPWGCHIYGDGKRASRLVKEPAAPSTHLSFNTGSSVQGQCSAQGLSFYGYGSEYVGTRYAKKAIAFYDGSEMKFADIGVNDFQSKASTGVRSEGIACYGKEITSFYDLGIYADCPVAIHANPYEPSISLDGFNFHNTYLGVRAVGESGVDIDANLRLLNFSMTGNTFIVGETASSFGKYGIHCDDPTGTADWTNFSISGTWRCEQMNDPTGASLYLNRGGTGRAIGLYLGGMNLGFQQRGIVLRGTISTLIESSMFLHQGGTVPVALDIGATCQLTSFHKFMVPAYGSPLVATSGQVITYDSGDTYAGYQLPTERTYNIP